MSFKKLRPTINNETLNCLIVQVLLIPIVDTKPLKKMFINSLEEVNGGKLEIIRYYLLKFRVKKSDQAE